MAAKVPDNIKAAAARLIGDRIGKLGWTQDETADHLSDVLGRTIGQKTVSGWTTKRTIPSIEVVIALAEAGEPDLRLVAAWERLLALQKLGSDSTDPFSPATLGKYLALLLDGGFDDLEPLTTPRKANGQATTIAELWEAAAQVLVEMSKSSRRGRTVLIDVAGMERAGSDELDAGGAKVWDPALRCAIRSGLKVVHVVGRAGDPHLRLPHVVQAEVLVNLLYAAAVGGTYIPVLDSPVPIRNVIAGEGYGTLAVWHHDLAPDEKLVQRYEYSTALGRRLTDLALDGLASDPYARSAVPNLVMRPAADPYEALRFDMTLLSSETSPSTEHCMIKAGLPVALIPDGVSSKQAAEWGRAQDADPALVELHLKTRERRHAAFQSAIARKPVRYRDILTIEGLRQYLQLDKPTPRSPGGALWGPQHLDIEDRILHAREVAAAALQPGYQVVLARQRDLPVPANDTWWRAVRGATPDACAVFYVAAHGEDGERSQLQGWLNDSSRTTMVESFVALFDTLWNALPNLDGSISDPDAVAAFIGGLADQAEVAIR